VAVGAGDPLALGLAASRVVLADSDDHLALLIVRKTPRKSPVRRFKRNTSDSSGSAGLVRLSSGFQNRVPCSQAKRQDSPRCFSVFRVISSSQRCVVVFHFAYFEAFFRAVFLSHVSPVIRNIPWVNFLKFVYSAEVSH
jgi:hypothetical protein